MKKYILFLFLILIASHTTAQDVRQIEGIVVARDTGAPVENARIISGGEIVRTTGANGEFKSMVSVYARTVSVHATGYQTKTIEVDGSYMIVRLNIDPQIIAEREAQRLKAEREAQRLKTEEEARLAAEEEARLAAEEDARLKAEEEVRLAAKEEARLAAEERTRLAVERRSARREAFAVKNNIFFISFDVIIPGIKHSNVAFGPMLGWCRKVGIYTKLAFSAAPDYYDYDGYNNNIYLSGEYRASYNAITAGLLVKLCKPLYFYTGVGGTWGKISCESALTGLYYLRSDYAVLGIDAGMILKMGRLTLNGGALYNPTMGWGCSFGIGVCF